MGTLLRRSKRDIDRKKDGEAFTKRREKTMQKDRTSERRKRIEGEKGKKEEIVKWKPNVDENL